MKRIRKNEKYGLMDDYGNIVIPPKYNWIDCFHSGLIIYKLYGKCGLIDSNGNEITPPKYDGLWELSNGFIRYKINKKYGFIDTNGNEMTKPLFDFIDAYYINKHSNNIFWGYNNIIFKNNSIHYHKIKILL
jgi:hypothetical protein